MRTSDFERGVPWNRASAAMLVVLAGFACMHTAWSADLWQTYQWAQDNDPVSRSARYALEAARQKVPEAVSALLPSVGVSGSAGRTTGDTAYTDTPEVRRGFDSNAWAVQLTQPIFRASNLAAYGESRAIAEQAVAQFRQAQEDLIVRVAQAYFDVLIAQEALQAAESQVRASQEQQAAAEHGYKAGTGAVTDAYEARAHTELARSERVAAQDDLRSKHAQLEALIGEEPPTLQPLKEDAVAPRPDPAEPNAWAEWARQNNAGVLAAQAALRAAQSEVFKARGQRLPSVDLIASVGRNYSSGNIINPIDYATRARDRQIGVQASMALLDGGGMHAAVRESLANQHKAEADLETAQRKAATEAKDAYGGVLRSLAQVDALQSAVSSGESAVTGNRRGYQLGLRINSDVLGSEQQLFASRRDLAKARYDALLQGLKLKAAAGALEPEDLAAINGLLRQSP